MKITVEIDDKNYKEIIKAIELIKGIEKVIYDDWPKWLAAFVYPIYWRKY